MNDHTLGGVDYGSGGSFLSDGQDVQSSQPRLSDTSIVSLEYFYVLGMTLLRGRLFADQGIDSRQLAIDLLMVFRERLSVSAAGV